MNALFLESLPYESAFRVGGHHYAERFLARGWSAMWLSHPLSPLHLLHPLKRDFGVRMRAWRAGGLAYGAMRYYNPMTLLPAAARPVLRARAIAHRSVLATVPSVRSVLHRHGFEAPDLLWLTNPLYQPLAARLTARCRVVRVPDDTGAFANIPDPFCELEAEAIEQADLVFAVASSVRDRLARSHPRVIHLPNGVDVGHFEVPRPEPADLAALPRPRVLYVGSMEYWFDAALVAECARALPESSFVLVGPESPHVAEVRELGNVHVLGPRPYRDIPAYMQHADAGIVPFARDEMVDSIHPIKVYEYLATGLPVVSIRWPELEAMAAPVDLAGREVFAERLAAALGRGRDEGSATRVAYARANSWDARFDVVCREVMPLFGEVAADAP